MAHFQPPTPIFTLRLSSTGGTLACTVPAPKVYLLHLTSPPDNRLTTTVCQALLLALDIIEHKYPPGVLVTMSGIPKFYSNGLDLDHAMATEGFWEKTLWPLFRRFLTFVHTPSSFPPTRVAGSVHYGSHCGYPRNISKVSYPSANGIITADRSSPSLGHLDIPCPP